MKTPYILSIITITAVALLQSCTKVIDYPLNDSESKLVIEAQLSNVPKNSSVKLSKSVNFEDDNTTLNVSNATVVITDQFGHSDTLIETTSGTYVPNTLIGKQGHTYTLSVKTEGKTYTATSTTPQLVSLDSIGFSSQSFFGSKQINAVPFYTDQAKIRNYYRFREYINNIKIEDVFIRTDIRGDGETSDRALNSFSDKEETKIKNGSTVTIEMMCIDPSVYEYFYALNQLSNGNSGTPANPPTNISGGALGYFSAQTFQKITTTYQEQ